MNIVNSVNINITVDIKPIRLNSNINCSMGRIQGNRSNMEDFYLIDSIDNLSIFALFDGHKDKNIANYLKNNVVLITNIILQYRSNKNFKEKISKEFIKIDKYLYNNEFLGGSTCLILYILPNYNIYINLGDSKGISIIENEIYFSTICHRPNNPIESIRIKNNKFNITSNKGVYRIDNILSLSRSFGDFKYKLINGEYNGINSAISVIPDIYINNNIPKSQYFILGTDGLWDYICNDNILHILNTKNKINTIVKSLILEAIKNGSNDNITIIVIKKMRK